MSEQSDKEPDSYTGQFEIDSELLETYKRLECQLETLKIKRKNRLKIDKK